MDPLTITLAVVTLATAVKDIVELARTIDDSLSKVSRNKNTMRKLSKQIIKIVLDLQDFCHEHTEALEKSSSLKSAVVDLHDEMRAVDERLRAMLPSPLANKLLDSKLKHFLAWMRRNKVQEELQLLLQHVRDCYLRFTTFSVLRMEGKLVLISEYSQQSSSAVQTSSKFLFQVSDESIATFLGRSTSVNGPKTSFELTRELIGDMHLLLQLEKVMSYLSRLAPDPLMPSRVPDVHNEGPLRLLFELPQSNHIYHSRAVAGISGMEKDLPLQCNKLSATDILRTIHSITTVLSSMTNLGMLEEGIALGNLALHFSRCLSAYDASLRHLDFVLLAHLGLMHRKKADLNAEKKVLFAALDLAQLYRPDAVNMSSGYYLGVEVARVLVWQAEFLFKTGSVQQSLAAAQEAVTILDMRFGRQFTDLDNYKISREIRGTLGFNLDVSITYSRSQVALSTALWAMGRNRESVAAKKRSLLIYERLHLLARRPLAEMYIAQVTFSLSADITLSHDERKQHGQRSLEIYRKYSYRSPARWGIRLYNSLVRES